MPASSIDRFREQQRKIQGQRRSGKRILTITGFLLGAGTVTANFDGLRKNTTVIKDRSFIGSDTVIIAPVRIGKKATTGAGSVVLKNSRIPDGSTVAGVPARILNFLLWI